MKKIVQTVKDILSSDSGGSPLVRQSTNRKRVLDTDRGEGGSAKKLKVWKESFDNSGILIQ